MPSQIDELADLEDLQDPNEDFSMLSMSSYRESDGDRVKDMIRRNKKKRLLKK